MSPIFPPFLVGTSYVDACLAALLEGFFLKGSVASALLDAKGAPLVRSSHGLTLAIALV